MSDPRDRDLDRLLGDDGGEFGALYRRLPRMEPPRRLDRSVLGDAARSVHGRTPRGPRWIVGLGSAAGVVLAAGIAWHVGHDALRRPAQDTFRDAPQVVPVEPITGVVRHREPTSEAQNEAAPPPAASMPAPPLKNSEHPRAAGKPLPAPPSRAPASPAQPTPSAAPPAAFPADAAQHEEKAQAAGAATGAAAAQRAPASDALDQAMSPRQRSGFAPAPSGSVELRRDLQLEPVDWLAHIRQLLHQGRRQQAIESLRLFHRAHPDWQLPDELRPLLD